MTSNGIVTTKRFDPATLRQLTQMYYAAMGAQQAAQAAVQVAQTAQGQFNQALRAACERLDVELPEKWDANIDFKTGDFAIRELD